MPYDKARFFFFFFVLKTTVAIIVFCRLKSLLFRVRNPAAIPTLFLILLILYTSNQRESAKISRQEIANSKPISFFAKDRPTVCEIV